jgi:hypothetical protein
VKLVGNGTRYLADIELRWQSYLLEEEVTARNSQASGNKN